MTKWLGGIRSVVVMVLTWTVGWGLGFGGLAELVVDPDGKIIDIWPTAMAIPGFIGGVVFAVLLLVAEGGRRFDDVSLARATIWGAATGVVLGGLTVVAKVGDASPGGAGMTALMIGLSVVAAIGSMMFFRLLARKRTPGVVGRAG